MRPGGDVTGIRAAYRRCEEITWSQARNFSYGIRLLPPPKRQALASVYAFARRIDDIGDGELPAPRKLAALAAARQTLAQIIEGRPDPADPVQVALAHAGATFPIPLTAFGELIEGCEADARGTSYPTFGDLLHYCRCVAGSIGRLSLGVFGAADQAAAAPLADALGVALQLTNILRDIAEDYRNGRVYLPAEDFQRFGATLETAGNGSEDTLATLISFEAGRAREWYAIGLRLMPMLDRRSAACAGAMAGIYFRLLERIAARPAAVLHQRVSLPAGEKALVALRSLAGAALRAKGGARGAGDGVPGGAPGAGDGVPGGARGAGDGVPGAPGGGDGVPGGAPRAGNVRQCPAVASSVPPARPGEVPAGEARRREAGR
jgi:phytoene synthase